MNKWIKIEERLPPESGSILLCNENGETAEGEYRNGRFIQYRWSCVVRPTHWQLLPPAPPKEASK